MNILIQNATVITVNAFDEVIENGAIGICGEDIEFVSQNIPPDFHADQSIDAQGQIVMPGLINAHCHSPMVMFRNYTSGRPLQEWLYERNRPLQQYVRAEDIIPCAELAYIEMIKSGTTAFAEMYDWVEILSELSLHSGLRVLLPSLYNAPREGMRSEERVRLTGMHRRDLLRISAGRLDESIVIHSVYMPAEKTICELAHIAKANDMPVQLHSSETLWELEETAKRFNGRTPTRILADLGVLDCKTIAAHCVHLIEEDRKILADKSVSVVHCPSSNLYLGSGIADVPAMQRRGINVCLGTDGAGSNNTLNMFKELHFAGMLHKGVARDASVVTPQEAVRMATINGAKALGIGDRCGSLEKGKKADIILLSTNEPHFTPIVNPYNAIVYAAQGSDVSTVMVSGKMLMKDRVVQGYDEKKVKRAANAASSRVLGFEEKQ